MPIYTQDYDPSATVRGGGAGQTVITALPPGAPEFSLGSTLRDLGDLARTGRDIYDTLTGSGGPPINTTPPPTGSCPTGYTRVGDTCVPIGVAPRPGGGVVPGTGGVVPGTGTTDVTPFSQTPAERGAGAATGIVAPSAVNVRTLKCPRYADGKTGILYVHPLSGQVVCLPRGVNGAKFGFIRKNKPRPKPPMTAGEAKALRRVKTLERKARKLASAAGFTCKAKSTRG